MKRLAAVAGLLLWWGFLPNRALDPRGRDRVNQWSAERVRESYRARLRQGWGSPWVWPGLANAQVSWIWLETLARLHVPESYEGDFSWLFAQLNSIARISHYQDMDLITALSPFFFVIGRDGAGSTLLMNEMVQRTQPHQWRPWFLASFHALENLSNRRLAGDLLFHAARNPLAPPYFSALALRLTNGDEAVESRVQRTELLREMDPALLEKIKKARPQWDEPASDS